MMITLIIYLLIIGYIILKAFYTSIFIKPSNNSQKIEKFSNSINYISMPFYINMPKIYLLCIFINLILISFIFLPNIMNDLILSISNSHIAYCQDNNDSDSTIDSDNEKSIVKYYGENDIYEINKNRKEEIAREERTLIYYEYGSRRYYPDNYTGIYKKTIEETYRISDIKFPYIHLLNSFSNFENDNNIKINNYLKIFQGFSKDIENLIEKQNNLIQKITPIDKHPFKISKISDMFYEISKRSMDTLVLISFAYDNIMDSFYKNDNDDIRSNNSNYSLDIINKPSMYYFNKFENSNEYKLFYKILNNKTNGNEIINENIRSFINDHQINNLNLKVTKIFNSLEIIQKISKENSNNLHELIAHPRELKDFNLKINNSNILIIQDIYSRMFEENQIKNFEKLYHYYKNFNSDENSEIDFNDCSKINWNKIENIHCNIQDFYKSKIFIKDSFKTRDLLDKGFFLKDNFYDNESFDGYDSDYYNNSSDSDDY
jgi:hypothetical protein